MVADDDSSEGVDDDDDDDCDVVVVDLVGARGGGFGVFDDEVFLLAL